MYTIPVWVKKLKDKGQTRRWHKRVGTCMKLHVCTYIRFQISNYPGSFLPRLLWLTPYTIGALFSTFIIRLLFLFRHLAPSFTNNFIPLCIGLNRSSLYQKKKYSKPNTLSIKNLQPNNDYVRCHNNSNNTCTLRSTGVVYIQWNPSIVANIRK